MQWTVRLRIEWCDGQERLAPLRDMEEKTIIETTLKIQGFDKCQIVDTSHSKHRIHLLHAPNCTFVKKFQYSSQQRMREALTNYLLGLDFFDMRRERPKTSRPTRVMSLFLESLFLIKKIRAFPSLMGSIKMGSLTIETVKKVRYEERD